MGQPVWITPAGNLGVVAENVFYTLPFIAQDPDSQPIKYSVVSGKLPAGLVLTSIGTISGVPTKFVANPTSQTAFNTDVTSTFTIRATTTTNQVADQSFFMTVTGEVAPVITTPPSGTNFGSYYTGQYFNVPIVATDSIPGAILTYSVVSGTLPQGISLDTTTGVISGHILEMAPANTYAQNYDESPYDITAFDFNAVFANLSFQFTIGVTDGIQSAYANYYMFVIAKNSLTADSTQFTADDTNEPTADEDLLSTPYVTTPGPLIGTATSQDFFAFQFQATDPDGDAVSFQIGSFLYINTTNITCDETIFTCDENAINNHTPPGLTLDPFTGWLYGTIPPLLFGSHDYDFTVQVFKTQFPQYISSPETYTIDVNGLNANVINWITPEDLGTIDNGAISILSVEATSTTGAALSYSIESGSQSNLPNGLELQQDGLITGRVSFEVFTLDNNTTTFDSNKTTFDSTYTFTVEAIDSTQTANSLRTFTLTVLPTYDAPYENLYLVAAQASQPRYDFNSFLANPQIFPQQYIYRFNDSYFGISDDLRTLIISGLNPALPNVFIAAMQQNHYRKQLWMGNVKTAIASDSLGNTIYEVVYVEADDPQENSSILGALSVLTEEQVQPYLNVDSAAGVVHPNSIVAMRYQISEGAINLGAQFPSNADNTHFTADDTVYTADTSSYPNIGTNIGIETYSAIPLWMTSIQPNGQILGFTQAFVLCYAKPGQSARIAYNISQSGYNFNENDFVVDRYVLDNSLSENYDASTGSFLPSNETTFDKFVSETPPSPGATVNFAITGMSYNAINGSTVSTINSNGGFDGVQISTANNGQTLVFAQQENYYGIIDPNFGWYMYTGGIPSGEIPGPVQSPATNERAGIWTINVNSITQVVTLTFDTTVSLNEILDVTSGNTYGGKQILYSPNIPDGDTVPQYTLYTIVVLGHETTFDHHSTRFYDNTDSFTTFGDGGTYLPFPKYDILV